MDALTHVLVPSLVLLAVGVAPRRVGAVAPLMVLADLDTLVGTHRAWLHNVFALVLVGAVVYAVARWRGSRDASAWGLLAGFAWGSHLALDVPTGVALLWPLTPAALFVSVQVFWDALAHAVVPVVEAGWLAHAPQAGDSFGVVTKATPWFVLAVANWSVVTLGVLVPAAWALFAPGALTWRARVLARVRSLLPAPTGVEP